MAIAAKANLCYFAGIELKDKQVSDNQDRFEEERQEVLRLAKHGIETNIPLKPAQKKYLKNLLLFSLMRASNNQTVTKPNFINLVKKLFKKYVVKIVHGSVKKMPNHNPLEDEEFYDENLEVEINNIIANEQLLDLQLIQQSLTPQNIIGQIRQLSDGLQTQQVIKRIMTLREINSNHRETPDEARMREKRQREYQRQRQNQRVMVRQRERGGRSW